MAQAYDLKDLTERFKSQGLEVAEDVARAVVEVVFAWVSDSVRLSATPFDDIALVVLPQLKRAALDVVDKIDGEVG